jgi:hypothetical protein
MLTTRPPPKLWRVDENAYVSPYRSAADKHGERMRRTSGMVAVQTKCTLDQASVWMTDRARAKGQTLSAPVWLTLMKATILAGRLQPDRVIAWVVAGLLAVPVFVFVGPCPAQRLVARDGHARCRCVP